MNKPTRLRTVLATSTVLVSGLLFVSAPALAQALPDTGNVTAITSGLTGGVPGSTNPTYNTTGAAGAQTLTVNLKDNRTILNWGGTGFDIAAGNSVNFADARATSGVIGRTDNMAVLNRDISGATSNIMGNLTSDANIAVYVINTSGILFGGSSVTNTGSFFGSALDLPNGSFLNNSGSLAFSNPGFTGITLSPGAQIHTTATTSTDGGRLGDLVLLGNFISGGDGTKGSLIATNGDLGLVAAGGVTVQSAPGSPLSFQVTAQSLTSPSTLVNIAADLVGRNISVATLKANVGNAGEGITIHGNLTATGAALTDRGVVLTTGMSVPGVTMDNPNPQDSGSSITINGSINSAKDITLYTLNDVSVASMTATGAIDQSGSGIQTAAADGSVTGSSVRLSGSGSVLGKVTATNGNIVFSGSHNNSLTLSKGAQASGDITSTGYIAGVAGDLIAGGKIDILAAGDFNGKIQAAGSINIDGTESFFITLRFNGDVVSTGGDVHINTLGHLIGGNFSAAKSLFLEGDLDMTVANAQGIDSVTLISDGTTVNTGTIVGVMKIGTVSTGASGDIFIRAKSLLGYAGGRVGALVAGRNIDVTANTVDAPWIEGTTGYANVTANGSSQNATGGIQLDKLVASTDATVTAPGTAIVNNATATNGNLSLQSGAAAILGSSSVATSQVAGGNLTIRAGTGAAQILGSATVGGNINLTGNNIFLGSTGAPGAQIRARGAINLTALGSSVNGTGNVLVQSNSDGIGNEAITISSATSVGFISGTSLVGGTAQQSDILIRSSATGIVQLGNVSARGLLGAVGADAFTNGITRSASIFLRGTGNLVNSLYLQGTNVTVSGPISVAAGDIDLRSASATTITGAISASGDVSARTSAGNLTLATGTTLTGRNVTLSTPAGFINNAGAGAVNASGHWVIYSANPTGDTFGGLDSGNTALWNATLATRDPSTVSGNRYVFAFQPTLAFTPQNFSKVYGTDLTGTNSAPFTVTGYQPGVAGAFLADTAASAYSGAPQFTSPGFAARAAVADGPYGVTILDGTLQSSAGYAFGFNAPAQLTITPKELVGIVSANSKTYDGRTAATGSIALSGIVTGDIVGTAGSSFAFADKNAGIGKSVTVSGTTLTGINAGNYTLTIPAGALADILKAALSGIVTVNNKTYDGTTAGSGSVALDGVIAGDHVGTTGTVFTFADRNAFNGRAVNVSGTTLTGADAGNYILSVPATAFADILKAVLTGTIIVNNKTYDGTTSASGSVNLTGVVAGDDVGATGTSFAFADKNAGAGKVVNVTGTTLTGADGGNYTLSIPTTAFADILKAALTGTITVNNKTYDGTTAATGSLSIAGVIAGDQVGTTGSTFAFTDKNAGTGKTVTLAGTTLTGADAGNYTISIPPTALADILKAALTGTVTVNNKTYDGTTTGSGSIVLNGVVAGDAVGTGGTAFTFSDKNAGAGKTVTISGTSLTGTDAGNYTLSIPASALADILKAVLTGTATVNNRTYNGTTAATGSVTLSGVVTGDNVGTTGTTFAFADKNAGTGKTVAVGGTTLAGTDAGNYTLSIPATALADILKAALTGTITVNNKTYDGTAAGTGSVALNGVIAGDTVGTGGAIFTFSDKNAGTGKAVTVSGTTLTGTDAGNYTLTIPAGALADILKKALTGIITVNGKTYDGTTTGSGSVTLSGVVAGDTVGTSGSVFTFADKNAGTGKTVTVGGTTLNGVDAGNYTLSLSASALGDIARRVIALTADNLSKTQGASDPSLTYTINSGSLVTGDTFSGALTRALGELPGPYAITQGSLSAGGNYTLNFTPGTLTINLNPVNQQPQTLRALTLPSQIQAQTPSSSNVTLDQKDLCGDDKNCVVK